MLFYIPYFFRLSELYTTAFILYRLYLTKWWFIGLLERHSSFNSQNFFSLGKKESIIMKKTYKILVNITGTEKVYKIPFDNRKRSIKKDIKPDHIKIQGRF